MKRGLAVFQSVSKIYRHTKKDGAVQKVHIHPLSSYYLLIWVFGVQTHNCILDQPHSLSFSDN